MNNRIGFLLAALVALFALEAVAQPALQPLNHQLNLEVDHKSNFPRCGVGRTPYHSSFKPLLKQEIETTDFLGRNENYRKDSLSWWKRRLFHEPLIEVNEQVEGELALRLAVDALLQLEAGRDLEDTANTNLRQNTRGFLVRGSIGEKVAFQSSFYENQIFLPEYLKQHADQYGVIPGQGRHKVFQETGYDYSMASGVISYSPDDRFNFRFGHGKNFVGDGYRSLLLSDNSFNYPYFRAHVNFGRGKGQGVKGVFRYEAMYAWLQTLNRVERPATPEASFQRKAATFHYLNWVSNFGLSVGIFEGVIFERADSNGTTDFDPMFLNPALGLNTAVFGFDDPSANALVGLNLKYIPTQNVQLYGQLMLDESNETGYQIGGRWFDAFFLENLDLRVEYNSVDPAAYNGQRLQNYAHYNEALAHPLGSNFREFIGTLNYRWRRFMAQIHAVQATWLGGGGGGIGNETLFASDEDFKLSIATPEVDLSLQSVRLSYLINPATNMQLGLAMTNRQLKAASGSLESNTQFVRVFFTTAIQNIYHDF